jgi:hypothetical protein
VGKNKGTTKTRKLTRKATFVRGKHLTIDRTGAPTRTLNVVKRAALNKDAPPMRAAQVGGKPTVFFKPHHREDAASQYAVASTRLARFLGMDKIIAHNAFAKVHNVFGAVSGAVPGSPLYSEEKNKEVQLTETNYSKQDIQDWLRAGQREERNGKYYEVSKQIYQWVDFKDPRIQKGMSDLQLFDAISGQVDRHAGNIYVDPTTGEVSGIDDDKSFGQGVAAAHQANSNIPGRYYRGLPALVDQGTAERILALDPTQLPEMLSARDTDSVPLSDDEIAEAVRRFNGVKQHLRDLQKRGDLIGQNGTSWNQATYDQARAAPTSSYLGFQAEFLENVIPLSANDPKYVILDAPPPPPPAPPPPPVPVPVGLTLAQALQGQPAHPQNVPPTMINQPPATGLLPPTQQGAITPPTQDASQAASFRLAATRRGPLAYAGPAYRGT